MSNGEIDMSIVVSIPDNLDVLEIRLASSGIGATQRSFADAIGVPVKTLRNWEQHRRQPTGSARVLLTMLSRDPRLVIALLTTPTA